MKALFSVITIIIFTIVSMGCSRVTKLQNYTHNGAYNFNFSKLSNKDIGLKITNIASIRGWGCSQINDNKLTCTLNVRDHQATVDIDYTQTGYAISYVSSKNLMYNQHSGTIHRNYHKWVKLLERDIDKAMSH